MLKAMYSFQGTKTKAPLASVTAPEDPLSSHSASNSIWCQLRKPRDWKKKLHLRGIGLQNKWAIGLHYKIALNTDRIYTETGEKLPKQNPET